MMVGTTNCVQGSKGLGAEFGRKMSKTKSSGGWAGTHFHTDWFFFWEW